VRHVSTLLKGQKNSSNASSSRSLVIHSLSIVFNIWSKNGGWTPCELTLLFLINHGLFPNLFNPTNRKSTNTSLPLEAPTFARVFSSTVGRSSENSRCLYCLACEARILGFHFLADEHSLPDTSLLRCPPIRGHYSLGRFARSHPPPSALIRSTLASSWRCIMPISFRWLLNAAVCHVTTCK
jgi:hypothetical protein